jgi:hypothetical protein
MRNDVASGTFSVRGSIASTSRLNDAHHDNAHRELQTTCFAYFLSKRDNVDYNLTCIGRDFKAFRAGRFQGDQLAQPKRLSAPGSMDGHRPQYRRRVAATAEPRHAHDVAGPDQT